MSYLLQHRVETPNSRFYNQRQRKDVIENVNRQTPVWIIPRESDTELAIRAEGRTLARLAVVPFHQRVGRATLWMGGVAGVNTDPAAREQGLARRLLTFAVEWMRDQGFDWSGLFGIPNFYTRFGYASALPEYELTIPTARAEAARMCHHVRPLQGNEHERLALLDIYQAVYATATGTVLRDPERWKGFLKGPGWGTIPAVVVAVDRSDRYPHGEKILGYAVYHKYSDGVTVAEISALAYSVYESLLAHFARLGVEKRASTLKFLVPKSHPLTEIARRFGCTWTVRFPADRDGMWRVLNLVPLMRKLAVEFEARLKEAGLFGTHPIPGIAIDTGECGSVSLYAKGDGLAVAPGFRDGLPQVSLDQQTLVQLLLGYRAIDEVLETQGLTASPAAPWLRALFPEVEGVLWWPDRF